MTEFYEKQYRSMIFGIIGLVSGLAFVFHVDGLIPATVAVGLCIFSGVLAGCFAASLAEESSAGEW